MTRRRKRKSNVSSGYPELTDTMIQKFADIAKLTSESIEKSQTREMILDPKVIQVLRIVEIFIVKHKLVVYGGTALNAVLPPKDKFYSPEYDLPDWDFFSNDPVRHAIQIADEVHKKTDMETFVTTAAHHGTYKVYADGISIADITHVETPLLDVLRKHALIRDDVLYSGPDYLRMAAYLELSRPRGQVERWEKVMKRISLVNRAHPIYIRDYKAIQSPLTKEFRRKILHVLTHLQITRKKDDTEFSFFGPESVELIRRSIGKDGRRKLPELTMPHHGMFPMIMSPDMRKTSKEILQSFNNLLDIPDTFVGDDSKIVVVTRKGRGEFLPMFNEIRLGRTGPVLCLIIGTSNGCQSVYHIPVRASHLGSSKKETHNVTIASVESCLYMYLAIRFAKILPVPASAILKVCDRLVRIHHRMMTIHKKPLLPLPEVCVGTQETIRDMRNEKLKMLRKIVEEDPKKKSAEYFLWNIKYNGGDDRLKNTIFRALEKYESHNSKRKLNKTLKHSVSSRS